MQEMEKSLFKGTCWAGLGSLNPMAKVQGRESFLTLEVHPPAQALQTLKSCASLDVGKAVTGYK